MKNLFAIIIAVLLFSGINANAQLTKIGGGVVIATGGRYLYDGFEYFNKSFGFDIRAEYDLNKKLRLVPDFQIFLPNTFDYTAGGESKTTLYAFDLNLQYILNPKKDFKFYFLGGGHIGGWHIKDKHSSAIGEDIDYSVFKFGFGANAGAGFKMKINYRLSFNAEVKYVIGKSRQMIFTPGFIYDI